jgi:hypothetical protein
MRITAALILAALLSSLGCGDASRTPETDQPSEPETAAAHDPAAGMPDDDVHRMAGAMPQDEVHGGVMGGGQSGMALNTEIRLDPAVAGAWSGIRVRLETIDGGEGRSFDVNLGETVPLGDSGINLTAKLFIPDFVMDEGGISSRSPEPKNPAARVIITESGTEPYEGWLFAAMPEIHPYPHDRYQVLLEEGIPAP